jgi:hypothetical protein
MRLLAVAVTAALNFILIALTILHPAALAHWYDVALIGGAGAILAVLVGLMSVDTEQWDWAGWGFAITFSGIAMLFGQLVVGVYQKPRFQSDEAYWTTRAVIVIGVDMLLVESIVQIFSKRRSLKRLAIRLSVLVAIFAAITGAVWVIQWIDWSDVLDSVRDFGSMLADGASGAWEAIQ